MATITRAPTAKEFASAWTRGFAKAARDAAGSDGRLSVKEAERIAERGDGLARYADNAVNYLERMGQKSIDVDKLIGKAHNYAYAVAEKAAGADGRVSLKDGESLPADIRGDFFALRGKAEPEAKLTGTSLVDALEAAATKPDGTVVLYMSEGDYPVLPVRGENPTGKVDGDTVLSVFEGVLTDGLFEDVTNLRAEVTSETFTKAESKRFLEGMKELDTDPDYRADSEAFARVAGVLEKNLKDIRVVKVGPKDDDGSLATDHGLYAYFVVGKTADDQLAGVYYGSVET